MLIERKSEETVEKRQTKPDQTELESIKTK